MQDNLNWIIGIGAQKAGTTWLGDYFNSHPEIYFSPLKELHFFDQIHIEKLQEPISNRFLREYADQECPILKKALFDRINFAANPEAYKSFFISRMSGQRFLSEITPSYAMLPVAGIRHMMKTLGRVKIIYILRNPADRAWSQLRMQERLSSGKLIASERITQVKQDPMIFGRSDYIGSLKRYASVLPSSMMHTLFFENLFSNDLREITLKNLNAFIGIEYQPTKHNKTVNQGHQEGLSTEMRMSLLLQLKDVYQESLSHFGVENLPLSWVSDMRQLKLV